MPLGGRKANIKITGSVGVSSTAEAATRSTGTGSATGKVVITDATRRHLDPDYTPVLKLNSTAVSSTAYTLQGVTGTFQWNTGDPSTGTYTADIEYLTASSLAQAREWTLNTELQMFDTTVFGSSGWKTFQPNLGGATATVGRFWADPSFFDVLELQSRLVVEFIVNSSANDRYEAYAFVQSDGISTPVDALVTENINLSIDGKLYFST